jgi:hypothetical protein
VAKFKALSRNLSGRAEEKHYEFIIILNDPVGNSNRIPPVHK